MIVFSIGDAAPRRCAGMCAPLRWRARWRRSATKRSSDSSRSSLVASSSVSTWRLAERGAQVGLVLRGQRGEALAERRVVGVDEQLLAALGVFDRDQAHVGQLQLQRVVQAHGQHLVAARQAAERLFPARRADEVGHHEDHRAAPDQRVGRTQQIGQHGLPRRRCAAARFLRDGLGGAAGCACAAAARARGCARRAPAACRRPRWPYSRAPTRLPWRVSSARQHGDEAFRHRQLGALVGAEVDRARQVEQEPGAQLAVFGELAHVRLVAAAR